MWQPNDELGILVIQEDLDEEPVVVFCSLFDFADRVFYEGRDKRSAGVKLSQLRAALDQIEEKLNRGEQAPF
jgi:hypothetical protein